MAIKYFLYLYSENNNTNDAYKARYANV